MDKKKTSVALGTFDGIHTGHQAVLNAALSKKRMNKVVVTFSDPPRRHSQKVDVPMLCPEAIKNAALKELGFDEIIILDYNKIHNLSPNQFLDGLFERYEVGAVSCGFNYRFGKDGKGDADFLSNYCKNNGAEAVICPAVTNGKDVVSSTYIRALIEKGEVAEANKMLYYPFSFVGKVIEGDKRGRRIYYPTINIPMDSNCVIPRYGVYASKVSFDGKQYNAVTNIGIRPTFLLKEPLSETHIIDFSGDLYGKSVQISLLGYLRPEKCFDSLNELQKAIKEDEKSAMEKYFKE